MLRVAVCDDNMDEVRRIEGFVRAYSDFDIAVYTSSGELVNDIDDGSAFDLYLLDIVMPEPDGIELARIIRRSDSAAAIIYLTSHDGHALDAYRVHAAQYLVKPVDRDTLYRELDAAITAIKSRNANTFIIKTKDGAQVVPFHRIAYFELEGRALCCVTSDGEIHRSMTLRTPFDEAVSEIMSDSRFIRPHFSFVVNMDYIKSVNRHSIVMKSGAVIPVSHGAAGEIKEKYTRYFFKGGGDAE